MTRSFAKLVGLFLLVLPLLAAVPSQEGPLATLPWWVWLVAVTVLLLLFFIIIIAFDWSSSPDSEQDEND